VALTRATYDAAGGERIRTFGSAMRSHRRQGGRGVTTGASIANGVPVSC
jgi:hypothetical protein